jgi:crotonobetainyl-CoA:carnitine CoA-transferase CaiB-like acyl-CoA transferase
MLLAEMGAEVIKIEDPEVFQARDGLIMICAGNDRLWRSLCEVMGRDDLATDPRFRTNQTASASGICSNRSWKPHLPR